MEKYIVFINYKDGSFCRYFFDFLQDANVFFSEALYTSSASTRPSDKIQSIMLRLPVDEK